MAVYNTHEKKKVIFKEYGGSETNSGSTQSQIALFSFRIKELTLHLNRNKKDFSCKRTLLTLVGKRRSLLKYLMKKDINAYRALAEKLGIRK